MLKEFEFFHGVVLARILHGGKASLTIKNYPTKSNASYVVNDKIGIYIKHSTKRMSPWRFTFSKNHQDEILEMKNKLREVYTILVCNEDGIACLSFDELKRVLDTRHDPKEWICVEREPRQKYEVTGSDGKLRFKIGNNEFPDKIFRPVKTKRGLFGWLK